MAKKEKKEAKQRNNYFKEMKAELKKVVWPTPKELVNNTIAVIAFVLIIAIIVFVLDFCFDGLNNYGITRLQEKVQSSFQSTDDSSNVSENQNETSENTENNNENSENNSIEENLEHISTETTENNTESNE